MKPVNDSAGKDAQPRHLAPSTEPRHHHFGLALIAAFKLVKGLVLLTAAIGLLNLLHTGITPIVEHWITVLGMDPDGHHVHWLLDKLSAITPQQIKLASAGSFVYSTLLLTEGFGLWFERRWAEYLTVIATSCFIPLEVYELCRRVSDVRLAVLGINLAIVWYLVRTLRRERKPIL